MEKSKLKRLNQNYFHKELPEEGVKAGTGHAIASKGSGAQTRVMRGSGGPSSWFLEGIAAGSGQEVSLTFARGAWTRVEEWLTNASHGPPNQAPQEREAAPGSGDRLHASPNARDFKPNIKMEGKQALNGDCSSRTI